MCLNETKIQFKKTWKINILLHGWLSSYQYTRKRAKLQHIHSIKTMGCPLTCNSLNAYPYAHSNILLMQWHIIHEWLTHSDVTLASAGLTSDINHSTRRDWAAHLPVTDCPFIIVYLIKAWLMAVILLSIRVFVPQADIILNMLICSQSKQKLVKIYYAKITLYQELKCDTLCQHIIRAALGLLEIC